MEMPDGIARSIRRFSSDGSCIGVRRSGVPLPRRGIGRGPHWDEDRDAHLVYEYEFDVTCVMQRGDGCVKDRLGSKHCRGTMRMNPTVDSRRNSMRPGGSLLTPPEIRIGDEHNTLVLETTGDPTTHEMQDALATTLDLPPQWMLPVASRAMRSIVISDAREVRESCWPLYTGLSSN